MNQKFLFFCLLFSVFALSKANEIEDSPIQRGFLECNLCVKGITWVEDELSGVANKTDEAIHHLIHEACGLFGALSKECDLVADHYLNKLIKDIRDDIAPRKICEDIHACDSSAEVSFELLLEESSESIVFLVRNHKDEDMAMLSWNTPLSGAVEFPMFVVRHSESARGAPYQGMLAKKANPLPEHVVMVPAKASIRAEIPLGALLESYEVSQLGDHEVQLVAPVAFLSLDQLEALPTREELQFVDITSNLVRLTMRSEHVEVSQSRAKQLANGLSDIRPGVFINWAKNCASNQQSVTEDSVARAVCSTNNAVPKVSDNSYYNTWFGAYTSSRGTQVKNTINNVHNLLNSGKFGFNCMGPQCSPGTFAYVYPTDTSHTIYVCDAYWSASQYIVCCDTKPGTIIHEGSHFRDTGATQDYTYGTTGAKRLASNTPDKAIFNADNYEYFNENLGIGGVGGVCRT